MYVYMYIVHDSHSWSVGEVALLQVLAALETNIVKEEEGTLAYVLTLVIEKG